MIVPIKQIILENNLINKAYEDLRQRGISPEERSSMMSGLNNLMPQGQNHLTDTKIPFIGNVGISNNDLIYKAQDKEIINDIYNKYSNGSIDKNQYKTALIKHLFESERNL